MYLWYPSMYIKKCELITFISFVEYVVVLHSSNMLHHPAFWVYPLLYQIFPRPVVDVVHIKHAVAWKLNLVCPNCNTNKWCVFIDLNQKQRNLLVLLQALIEMYVPLNIVLNLVQKLKVVKQQVLCFVYHHHPPFFYPPLSWFILSKL